MITVAHANALLYETELQMIEDVSSRLVIMILRLDDPNYEFEKTLLSQVIGESLPQEEIDLLLAPVAPEPQLGSQVFASANPPLPLERQDSPFLVSPKLAEELPDETSHGMVVLGSMEEFESLAGFEEIQELFERKVDGRKVPKKHYFEELKSYNTRQAESTKVEGQHNRYMFRWTEHPNKVNFNNPAQLVQCLEREGPMKDSYFQMEKGEETGKLHYQGFVKFSEKKRGKTLAKKLNPYLFGIELQAARAQDSICIDYVMKEDTRVSGPYTKRKLDTTKYPEVKPIIDSPYAWQSTVLSQLEENPPFRRRNSIYDAVGNSGKTMFCKYLVLKTQGTRSPTYYLGYGRALDVKYALAKVPTEGYPRPLLFDFTRTKRAFYDMTEL